MIFSYGFLDSDVTEVQQVMLDINFPDDDPLGVAKKLICQEFPGIKVSRSHDADGSTTESLTKSGDIAWDSPLIWWSSVNEEDGLCIGVTQTTEGTRELEATWKGQKLQSPYQLRDFIIDDPLVDVFRLRAVVLVLGRLQTQLSLLQEMEEFLANVQKNPTLLDSLFRREVFGLILRLRKLEGALLEKAIDELLQEVSEPLIFQAGSFCRMSAKSDI